MAINYTYPQKGSPSTSDSFLIIDSEDSNSTKEISISSLLLLDNLQSVSVESPILNLGTSADIVLSLDTVPISKGGIGLTSVGTEHQMLAVNQAEDGLEYKDVKIVESVLNTSGSLITKGTPVYITGWNEGLGVIEVAPADASGSGPLMPAVGLANSDIDSDSTGSIMVVGVLEGIATNSYGVGVGEILYVAKGGGLTGQRPTGDDLIQPVAVILKSAGAGGGVLQVATVSEGASIPNVNDGKIIIGNASNVGEQVEVTGEVTISNTGVTEVTGVAGNVPLVGYKPVVLKTGETETIEPSDIGKTLVFDNPNVISVTLVDSTSYPAGSEVDIILNRAYGVSTLDVYPDTGVTINGSSGQVSTATDYGQMTLKKISNNQWVAYGDLKV